MRLECAPAPPRTHSLTVSHSPGLARFAEHAQHLYRKRDQCFTASLLLLHSQRCNRNGATQRVFLTCEPSTSTCTCTACALEPTQPCLLVDYAAKLRLPPLR